MDDFRYIKYFIKAHYKKYLLGIFLLIVCDVLQLMTPTVVGNFTDALTDGTLTMAGIPKYMFLVVIIAAGVAIGRFGWRMSIITTSKRMEYWLRNKLFSHLEKQSLNYYTHHKTGDLMAHLTNDIGAIRQTFSGGVVMFIDASFMSIMTIVLMIIRIDLKLTLLAIIPLPFIAFFIIFFGKKIRTRFNLVQEAFSDLTDITQESFSGIRIIKSFVQETKALKAFNEKNQQNFDTNINLIKIMGFVQPLVGLIASSTTLITIFVGGSMVINGQISIGDFVSFQMYVGMLTWPMMALGFVYNNLQRGQVSLKRINKILDEVPEIRSDESAIKTPLVPSIRAENLSFKYPGSQEYALKNISFDVKPGQTLAIIGRTGSGKTTLMNLFLHLYDTSPGQLFIGDQDMCHIDIQNLRNHIGYVPQDNFLFSKTIAYNICFGHTDVSQERAKHFADVAQIDKEIQAFTYQYDTLLGERGVNMSGGQKQRTSIARALAKEPSIVLLDDSLSAVDTKTEESILTHLNESLNETTTVIIAHRVSTLKNADHILVLDQGQVLESGNHASLLELDGAYADLYRKQLLEEKIEKE